MYILSNIIIFRINNIIKYINIKARNNSEFKNKNSIIHIYRSSIILYYKTQVNNKKYWISNICKSVLLFITKYVILSLNIY